MRKIKQNKKFKQLLASLLTVVFVYAPFRPSGLADIPAAKAQAVDNQCDYFEDGYEYIDGNSVWGAGEHLIEKGVFIDNGATLTIEKGANIVFKKTSSDDPFLQIGDGSVVAAGTQEERITFTAADESSKNFYIAFDGAPTSGVSFFRYVDFMGGGKYYGGGAMSFKNNFFINTAFAAELQGYGTLQYQAGKIHIENSKFEDSEYFPVTIDSYVGSGNNENGFLEIINSNFGNNSNNLAVSSALRCTAGVSYCSDRFLLKNNWYGSPLGPNTASSTLSDGAKLEGDFLLDGWRENELIADPTLIVPGIMGSEKFLGTWKLDPITHVYDDLVSSLDKNGFTKNVNLFDFPYEWRNNNETSARFLQARVEGVINEARVSRVDVVAHSMGGLVVRAYIEDIDGAQYENTIDELITLGTPNQGSPEAYLNWESGEGFFTLSDKIARYHFQQEAEHAGYNDLGKYIREKVTSVKELLPNYDYLTDASTGIMRNYPENYPRNTFLEELNAEDNLEKLKKVNYTNIVGKLEDNNSTIAKIRVVDSAVDGKWQDGMPQDFYDSRTDQGLLLSFGDETVPIESAKGIESDKLIEISATHQELPDKAQCEVFEELTGENECQFVDEWHMTNLLLFNVFSPIDIQIVSPSGKRVGRDFEHEGEFFNEIEGAFYSGSDSENEFVTIPNPEDGEYKIMTSGTGDGEYRVEAVKISEDPVDSSKVIESVAIINGIAAINKAEELKVEVKEDSVVDKNAEVIVPPIEPSTVPPATPPTPPVVDQSQTTVTPAPVVAEKKAGHKKKKSHKKKAKKSKVSKAVSKVKKVLGISKNKNTKQKNVVTKSLKYVAKKSMTVWQSTVKAANTFKNFILKPFSIFKR